MTPYELVSMYDCCRLTANTRDNLRLQTPPVKNRRISSSVRSFSLSECPCQQVRIQLAAYADNVALPGFVRRSCSNPRISRVRQTHRNKDSLATRREDLSQRFSRDIMDPASCLHSLLPPPRSTAIASRLRSSQILPRVHTRTKRYCSFIQYGLNHYQ